MLCTYNQTQHSFILINSKLCYVFNYSNWNLNKMLSQIWTVYAQNIEFLNANLFKKNWALPSA